MRHIQGDHGAPHGRLFQGDNRLAQAGVAHGFTLVEMLVVTAIVAIVAGLTISRVDAVCAHAKVTATLATLHGLRDTIMGSAAGSGYLIDMKYSPGFQCAHLRLHDLMDPSRYPAAASYDPTTRRGWRGPYVQATAVSNTNPSRHGQFPAADERRFPDDRTFLERGFFYDSASSYYGTTGDAAVADPWGNPIVLQVPPTTAFGLPTGDMKQFRYARLASAGPNGLLETPRDRLAGMSADGTVLRRGDDLVLFLNRPDRYENEEP